MTEIQIDKNEVLRYLGYRSSNVDKNTSNMIDHCITELRTIARYRYTYSIFDIEVGFYKDMSCINVKDTNLRFTGNDIYEHLRDSRKCAVMAVTLGVEVDNAIRLAQNTDMLKAVVLDSCASEYIEKVCDYVKSEILIEARKLGCGINFAFAPGYGDFPLDIQKKLVDAVDAGRKIGLTVTENYLMIPRKSVTGVVGFVRDLEYSRHKSKCETCSMRKTCVFRKDGKTCGRN